MYKKITIIFVLFLSVFLFKFNVYAECSYKERKELLNSAKSVDISISPEKKEEEFEVINPNSNEESTIKETVNYFKLNVVGDLSNVFVKITNNYNDDNLLINVDDMNDGVYTYDIDDRSHIITYYIDFYSTNNNCYAEKITTKTIKKARENPLHYYNICSNKEVENNKYCKEFITTEFNTSEEKIIRSLESIINNNTKEEQKDKKSLIDTIKRFWYIPAIAFVLLFTILIVIKLKKKSGEL